MYFLWSISYLDVVGLVVGLPALVIIYLKWKFTFWKKLGIQSLNPSIPFGDIQKLMLGQATLGEQFAEFYNKFKSLGLKHGGVFFCSKPFYIPTDLKLIKCILSKDFQHFVNHSFFIDENNDPLSGHIINLEDSKWKNMRIKLTPTFTSIKMKMMFETFVDCASGLRTIMDEAASNYTPIEIKDVLGRFTTDIIGSVAFGLECNSLKDPNALFRKYSKKVFEYDKWDRLKFIIQFSFPRTLLKLFKFKTTKPDVEKFFMKITRDIVAYREKNNVYRKDFMHSLIQLKNRGTISDDKNILSTKGTTEGVLTMNELAAQCYAFFLAGFETSSTTMTFALYELAQHTEIQEKLRNEINIVLAKYNNQVTYDGLMEMTYMDKVIYETLRKHPPLPFLLRQCTKEYPIPNTSIVLPKNIDVGISVLGIHRDPQYYPDPENFDPERFSEKVKQLRPAFTWLPFGEGPRNCIGVRFGMLQTKVGLITLLQNYKITLNSKTQVPLKISKSPFVMTADDGIWLNIKKNH